MKFYQSKEDCELKIKKKEKLTLIQNISIKQCFYKTYNLTQFDNIKQQHIKKKAMNKISF